VILKDEPVITDVLVLGGGIAGCLAAIQARASGQDVLLVDKGHLGRSGTSFQMSGVLTYFDLEKDSLEDWYRECVEAGQGVVDLDQLEGAIPETSDRIHDLRSWGVEFLHSGQALMRRPGVGHLHARNVVMAKGGFQLQSVLRGQVFRRGIRVMERVMTTDLVLSKHDPSRVVGAAGFSVRTGKFHGFGAKAIVIATGSTRAIWTGMRLPVLSGDGKAMAFAAGCQMRNVDLSYFQEAPRDLNIGPGANLLYGLGAVLINARGERFMEQWDPVRLDRAPRAVHCRAIAAEEQAGRGPVYMDATGLDESAYATIEKALPILVMNFETARLDLRRDKIPYTTVLCDHGPGGIRVDRQGRTSLTGLYAAGDAADHASDGASNIITHGMISAVEGHRAGEAAALYAKVRQKCMALWRHLGPIRHEQGLKGVLKTARDIKGSDLLQLRADDYHQLSRCIGLENELLFLEMLAASALYRTESRGSHFREDFPEKDDKNWLKWVITAKKDGKMKVWDEPVPQDKFSRRPKLEKLNNQTSKI
jgi:succinate dehydrogenase/fumarate reductase flavoprotein subunit